MFGTDPVDLSPSLFLLVRAFFGVVVAADVGVWPRFKPRVIRCSGLVDGPADESVAFALLLAIPAQWLSVFRLMRGGVG
jgi:hypothetical protein